MLTFMKYARNAFKHGYGITVLTVTLYYCMSVYIPQITTDGTRVRILDFAHYMTMGEALLFDRINIYSADGREAVFSRLAGHPVNKTLSISIPPPGFLIWSPIVTVSRWNLTVGYALWLSISLYLFIAGLLNILSACKLSRIESIFFAGAAATVFFSRTGFSAFALGQTPLALSGVLMLLGSTVLRRGLTAAKLTIALLLGCLKPPYGILILALALALHAPRSLLLRALILPVVFVALSCIYYGEMIPDYFSNSSRFITPLDSGMTSVKSGYVPSEFTLFRSAAAPFLGEDAARRMTLILLALGFCVSAWGIAKSKSLNSGFLAWGGLLSTYLLFAPYAGEYENVLIVALLALVALSGRCRVHDPVVAIVALGLVFNHKYFSSIDTLWIFWSLKFLFLAYLGAILVREDDGRSSRSAGFDSDSRNDEGAVP